MGGLGEYSVCHCPVSFFVFTARSELRKVLFLALSVSFLFVYEIYPEPLNGFAPNSQEDVFGPSLRVFVKVKDQRSRSPGTKTTFFDPFGVEPWLMARWKARVEFLLSVIELLFLSLTVEALQGKMCQNSLPLGGVDQFEPRFQGEEIVRLPIY